MAARSLALAVLLAITTGPVCSLFHDAAVVQHYNIDFVHVAVSGALADSNSTQAAERRMPHVRLRRQTQASSDKTVRGFTTREKRILVDRHNILRREAIASDMNYMYWDPGLESLAQDWAEQCDFNHRPSEQRKKVGTLGRSGPFEYCGENLFASSGGYDAAFVVQEWYNEVADYNYDSQGCSGVCGHYTQIVWATSYALGCGVAYCSKLTSVNFDKGWHVVCNYGPGGNYRGEKPYRKGATVSQCEQDSVFRINGLCAKYPVIESKSAASVTAGGGILQLVAGWAVFILASVWMTPASGSLLPL